MHVCVIGKLIFVMCVGNFICHKGGNFCLKQNFIDPGVGDIFKH